MQQSVHLTAPRFGLWPYYVPARSPTMFPGHLLRDGSAESHRNITHCLHIQAPSR